MKEKDVGILGGHTVIMVRMAGYIVVLHHKDGRDILVVKQQRNVGELMSVRL